MQGFALLITLLLLAVAPAAAGEVQGTAVSKVRLQDWALVCQATAAQPATVCAAYTQNGRETAAGLIAVRLTVQRQGGGHSVFLDVTPPLGGDLSFSLQVDGKAPLIGQVPSCGETRCRIAFTGERAANLIAQFKPGNKAAFRFLDSKGAPVLVWLSLRGFTATLAALDRAR